MRERIPTIKQELPTFLISDEILKDTKNILSCEVIKDKSGYYIAHVEFQPESKKNNAIILNGAMKRLENKFGEDFASNVVFRIHSFNESFELTGCGKRNNNALFAEGLSEKCVIPKTSFDGEYVLTPVIINGVKVLKK